MSGEEKRNLLKNASFLIVTSIWHETFGLTILEAYSNHKPVIASKIGGLPSIVKDGETGFLFEAGNTEKLKEAVLSMIENERFLQLGENSYRYFLDNFTEKQNYEQLMTIYQSAIEAKALTAKH